MNSGSMDFSMHALEARFEMQYYYDEFIGAGDGGGGDYGYYGNSWNNYGSGNGYVGLYQTASDGSGAMFDDGSYTDGSSGAFPSYNTDPHICLADPNFYGCQQQQSTSRCTICRC
ncbi:MAG TPA: hypothetical protein VKB02_10810 [Pyrinomonadaceae bacterium]|nr:hypothetical protein [Pyrinomonadaceae bacterium]